jgi:hypothetical protein
VLVNVLFLAFDHWVTENCRGIFYYRYCDDFLFLSDNRSEVERAVKELRRCKRPAVDALAELA